MDEFFTLRRTKTIHQLVRRRKKMSPVFLPVSSSSSSGTLVFFTTSISIEPLGCNAAEEVCPLMHCFDSVSQIIAKTINMYA